MRKTQDVYELVRDVLQTIPQPYGQDIIEDVFVAIEQHPEWYERFMDQREQLTVDVVNNWIGKYTKQLTAAENVRKAPAKRTKLTKTFTKLRH